MDISDCSSVRKKSDDDMSCDFYFLCLSMRILLMKWKNIVGFSVHVINALEKYCRFQYTRH